MTGSATAGSVTAGSLIGDRFTLGVPLGRGSMGTVWEAYDEHLHRRVAVKQLALPDVLAARRFRREARLTARLNHPGVPAIYDVGDDYIAMEYIDGNPLRDLIAELAPVPDAWVAAIGLQIAAVLSCAHRVGLIHRDLQPANLLLTPTGEVKVIDFGVATLVDSSLSTLTPAGVIVGTAAYQAPERHLGSTGPRSDLYSFGCVLRNLGGAALSTVVASLTAPNPEDRPDSARALIPLLRPWLKELPPLPGFVPDPRHVLDLTSAYLALAAAPAPAVPAPAPLPPRQARAEAERLTAADRHDEAIALLDAVIAAAPDDAFTLDLRRDLTHSLLRHGDIDRPSAELTTLIPDLARRLGPEHTSVLRARAELGETLAYRGESSAALAVYEELLTDQIRLFGVESPPATATKQAIAGLRHLTNQPVG